MFSNGRYIYPIYDNGTLGGTQSVLYIETLNEITGNNLICFINSNLFKFLIKTTKFNNFAISHEFISIIGDLSKIIENIDDIKINEVLKITEEENDLINVTFNLKKDIENDDTDSKSSVNTKKHDIILCGAPLKKKGATCKNKVSKECNGRCKKHSL
jgi:hypothetical protein